MKNFTHRHLERLFRRGAVGRSLIFPQALSRFSTARQALSRLSRMMSPRIVKKRIKAALVKRHFAPLHQFYAGIGTCLAYHRIIDERPDTDDFQPNIGISVHRDDFEHQMKFVKDNYTCLPLPTAALQLAAGTLLDRSLIVTFDDGYRDNITVALPILERYQIPATIFVSPGLIDHTARLWWYEQEEIIRRCEALTFSWAGTTYRWDLRTRPLKQLAIEKLFSVTRTLCLEQQQQLMSELITVSGVTLSHEPEMLAWSELLRLSRHPLITIGAHTVNHPVLSRLSTPEVLREMRRSRRILQERLGIPIEYFAYPFGGIADAGRREFEASKRSFFCAFTTRLGHLHRRHRHYLHSLPRVSVMYQDSFDEFLWKVSGMGVAAAHRGRRFITNR